MRGALWSHRPPRARPHLAIAGEWAVKGKWVMRRRERRVGGLEGIARRGKGREREGKY